MHVRAQTMAVCEVPLSTAEFMKTPRKVVQLDVPMFKPEAHGHLLKLAKVGGRAAPLTGLNLRLRHVGENFRHEYGA